jgi:MSHA biogenesis protein MshP
MSTIHTHFLLYPQRGFAIVAAIFLLVILSALGAFMLTMSSSQQITSAQDIQGTRAYWAAKAGIQWAASQVQSPAVACPAASTTFALDGFNVTVACTAKSYAEGTSTKIIYWVESTAKSTTGSVGQVGYTERVVNAFIEF